MLKRARKEETKEPKEASKPFSDVNIFYSSDEGQIKFRYAKEENLLDMIIYLDLIQDGVHSLLFYFQQLEAAISNQKDIEQNLDMCNPKYNLRWSFNEVGRNFNISFSENKTFSSSWFYCIEDRKQFLQTVLHPLICELSKEVGEITKDIKDLKNFKDESTVLVPDSFESVPSSQDSFF